MAYETINNKVVVTPTRSSGAGRKGFFNSKREQYKQYRAYIKEYNKVHKEYGNNMTHVYSYNAFKRERSEELENAARLDYKPKSLKQMAKDQIRTSYLAARTRVGNFKANLKNVMKKERAGEQLTLVEERMLEFGTEEVQTKSGKIRRVMKDISWKEYRNEEGVLVDLNSQLAREGFDYEEDVFGSPNDKSKNEEEN